MSDIDRFTIRAGAMLGDWLYELRIWSREAAPDSPSITCLYSDDQDGDGIPGAALYALFDDLTARIAAEKENPACDDTPG